MIGGSGGGSAVPAGTTGQVQYNSGTNTLAANQNFTFLTATNALVVGTGAATPQATTGTVAIDRATSFLKRDDFKPQRRQRRRITVNTGATGQMAYYSGANAISGTPNLYVSGSNIGIGTSAATYLLSLDGQSARTVGMQRDYTASTAGQALTLQAGGAASGGTNLNGGNLVLSGGISTGTGTSQIQFQTAAAGSSGSTDRTPATVMTITGAGNVGIGTTNPQTTLDVAGYINAGDSSGDPGLFIYKGDASGTNGNYFAFLNTGQNTSNRLAIGRAPK